MYFVIFKNKVLFLINLSEIRDSNKFRNDKNVYSSVQFILT